MIKKRYYLITVLIISLIFSNKVFAGETYATYTYSSTPGFTFKYISNASISATDSTRMVDGQVEFWDFFFTWSFNNLLNLTNATGKYIYGTISQECDLYIPNPDTTQYSIYSGVISGDPIISETLRIYPEIVTTTSNHYIYRLIYVFDGYCYQGENIVGPEMTISNLKLHGSSVSISPANVGVTVTGTTANAYNHLRYEDQPLNRGLVGLIADGLDNSDKLDLMLQYLYDIKQNDIGFYSSTLLDLADIETVLNTIQSWTASIYGKVNNIDTNTTTILNDLEAYIDFMEDFIPYLQNISTNTLNTYNQLVTIYNYMVNRPSIKYEYSGYHMYVTANGKLQLYEATTNRDGIWIPKSANIEYIYFSGWSSVNYPEIIYFENKPDTTGTLPKYIECTRLENCPNGYQYYTIDFKYNENWVFINLAKSYNTNFNAYIGNGYSYSALMYYIESMQKMNPSESSAAAEIESQYNEKENQSESLANGLGQLVLPSVNSSDFDILSRVDTNTRLNFFGLLSTITNNSFITTMLLIICTGAIVGYILYGKKS